MAPLDRSFSLPTSLTDGVSRLKVFSGAAGKDEVSRANKAGHPTDRSGKLGSSISVHVLRDNSPAAPFNLPPLLPYYASLAPLSRL